MGPIFEKGCEGPGKRWLLIETQWKSLAEERMRLDEARLTDVVRWIFVDRLLEFPSVLDPPAMRLVAVP